MRGAVCFGWVGILLAGLAVAEAAEAQRGKALYAAHCESCHGPAGRGGGPDAALFPSPPRDLQDGVLRRYGDDALVRRIREGRGLPLTVDPAALRTRIGQVDQLTAHVRRMPSIDWAAVRRGEEVYATQCERCHGVFGEAPSPGPLDLADSRLQERVNDDTLRSLMRHGHATAPAPSPPLSASEQHDLLAFVRSLSPGAIRYFRYCAPCHGDDGRPVADLPPDMPRPVVTFDAAYVARTDPDDLETAVWHMVELRMTRMPHMRVVLDDSQIRAILAYLRSEGGGASRR